MPRYRSPVIQISDSRNRLFPEFADLISAEKIKTAKTDFQVSAGFLALVEIAGRPRRNRLVGVKSALFCEKATTTRARSIAETRRQAKSKSELYFLKQQEKIMFPRLDKTTLKMSDVSGLSIHNTAASLLNLQAAAAAGSFSGSMSASVTPSMSPNVSESNQTSSSSPSRSSINQTPPPPSSANPVKKEAGELSCNSNGSSGTSQMSAVAQQNDYFRNCNVPNLINKWRRRHGWLFLKEGKMFCQACIDFKAVAKRYGRCDERNKFCNEGSTNFRSSAVEDHARSETHLRAVRATTQQPGPNFDGLNPLVDEPQSFPSFTSPGRPTMVPRSTPFERNRQLGIPDVFDMPELQSECRATGSPHARQPAPSPLATAANAAAASVSAAVGEQQDNEMWKYALDILRRLRQQRSQGILCDVWIRYPNRQFQAHKAFLSAASPVLAERLELDSVQKNISEIEVQEIKPQIFQQVIDYIYSGEIPAEDNNGDLLSAAKFLKMSDLVERLTRLDETQRQTQLMAAIFGNNNRKRKRPTLQNSRKSAHVNLLNGLKHGLFENLDASNIDPQTLMEMAASANAAAQENMDIKIEEVDSFEDEDGSGSATPPKMPKSSTPPAVDIPHQVKTEATVSPPTGSSRRKGASKRIAPISAKDEPLEGVEEWLTAGAKNGIAVEPGV
ncbi:unnamed protein product [Oikopleura dioica]|uniref:BTB domain-containing protein n=1 Tax=Oikopleura dioica TaxID=34765 RepID=E4WW10_OIKDI|nr:unnamed protein product [Oikopleura dioica]